MCIHILCDDFVMLSDYLICVYTCDMYTDQNLASENACVVNFSLSSTLLQLKDEMEFNKLLVVTETVSTP